MSESLSNLQLVYCHGLPGSAEEIETLIPQGCRPPSILKPLNFHGFNQLLKGSRFEGVHLIGFSMGAMTAIEMAAKLPSSVKKMTLIAPAAPLELGDFLPKMAGRPVFSAAKSGDILFRLFTAAQRLGVAAAPEKIIETMFKEGPKADKDLLSSPRFKHVLVSGLKQSFGRDRRAYHQAIRHYVQPWAHSLADIRCPVAIHHGTKDNWAPLDMSHRLKQTIMNEVELITYEELGHYSTLHKVLPSILTG